MSFLKSFLTNENVKILDFNISTLALTFVILFVLIWSLLKFKNVKCSLLKIAFFCLTMMTLLSALFLTLTGEFLFAQNNLKVVALIATVALTMQVKDNEIFKSLVGKIN